MSRPLSEARNEAHGKISQKADVLWTMQRNRYKIAEAEYAGYQRERCHRPIARGRAFLLSSIRFIAHGVSAPISFRSEPSR